MSGHRPSAPPALLGSVMRLAAPSIVENLMQSTVFLADALMLAMVGERELAALSLAGIFLWRATEVVGCLQIGTAAYVARRWGEMDARAARVAATHGMLLAAILGALAAAMVIPHLPWTLRVLGGGDEVVQVGVPYTTVILIAFPFVQMRLNLGAAMRAAGDTLTPSIATAIVNVLNIFLNWVLIFGKLGFPALGMFGSGIATAIAFLCGWLFLIIRAMRGLKPQQLFVRPVIPEIDTAEGEPEISIRPVVRMSPGRDETRLFQLTREGLRWWLPRVTGSILRVSRPALLEEIFISIGFLGFFRMIAEFGTMAMAAHAAAVRIESMSFMLGVGFAVSASTLVGQSLGRREPRTAGRVFLLCSLLAITLMGGLGIVFALFPEWLVGWFSDSPAFIHLAAVLLLIAALEQPLLGLSMTLSGGLRGAGDTAPPALTQFVGTLGVRIGFGYLLGYHLGLGMVGLYWATLIDWCARSALLGCFVLRGRWRERRL